MKWLAILLIGCAVVTAWARTVPAVPVPEPTERSLAVARLAKTSAAIRIADAEYREHARADSLLPLLPAEPGVTVALPAGLPRVTADSIRAALARELAEVGAPRARLGVFLIDDRFGERAARYAGVREEREIHVGTDWAGAFCAMVGTALVRQDGSLESGGLGLAPHYARLRERHGASVLGPCAFVARYGAPGDRIAQWLADGGWRFAELRGAAVPAWDRAGPAGRPQAFWFWNEEDLLLRGCRGGRAERCIGLALLSPAEHDAGAGAATYDLARIVSYDARPTRSLLHDLEQQFGSGRFARFWTSDTNVQAAFASAFDVELSGWLRGWARERYGTATLGAGVDALSLLLTALTVGILATIAALVAVRRRI